MKTDGCFPGEAAEKKEGIQSGAGNAPSCQ